MNRRVAEAIGDESRNKAMADEPCRPSERDMIDAPRHPDLRCREHDSLCEVAHSLHRRIMELEERVTRLESGRVTFKESE